MPTPSVSKVCKRTLEEKAACYSGFLDGPAWFQSALQITAFPDPGTAPGTAPGCTFWLRGEQAGVVELSVVDQDVRVGVGR